MKTGRNSTCPCRSGEKYKRCCELRGIDFSKLSRSEWIKTLSVRGKNIYFINMIAEALRLDSIGSQVKSFPEFVKLVKSAVTPEAVRKIHLAVAEIWPDKRDLERCLAEEKSRHSGLYIGTYQIGRA